MEKSRTFEAVLDGRTFVLFTTIKGCYNGKYKNKILIFLSEWGRIRKTWKYKHCYGGVLKFKMVL